MTDDDAHVHTRLEMMDEAGVGLQVLSPADVSGTKTVSGSFIANGLITYTIVLTNNANFDQQDNTGNEFTDTLPASLTGRWPRLIGC